MSKRQKLREDRYAARPPVWLDPLKIDHPANILLVEDDRDILQLLRFFIESIGASVDCLSDGDSVIEYMASEVPPDLILLDRSLPGLSGDTLLKRFRKHSSWSAIPVIVVSALNEPVDIETILASGANDYITKPFAPVNLVRQLNRQLLAVAPHKAKLN